MEENMMYAASVKKMKAMTKAYNVWQTIENAVDLRKNKLTLNEYQVLTDILRELSAMESDGVYTFFAGVAEWCRKHGLVVIDPDGESEDDIKKVNYWIGLIQPE